MSDIEVETEKTMMPERRRRMRFYLPSRYAVHDYLVLSVAGCALFGGVLGDIWLWRLLYG